MSHALPAAFIDSGLLDRAAHLRANSDQLWTHENTRIYLLWRGKVLAEASGQPVVLTTKHPLVVEGQSGAIFLGLVKDAPCFAVDISAIHLSEADAGPVGLLDASIQTHPDLAPGQGFHDLRALLAQLSPEDGTCLATARALFSWHDSHRFCARCGAPSAVTQSGWQRACGTCSAQHFPRTDPVVIMLITDGDRLLLGRGPTWPEGMYSLLAGFIEPGETIEAAVRRETVEESGITVGEVAYIASQPWPFPASLMLGCIGQATSRDIKIDPNELQDARWVDRSTLALVLAGQHPEIRAPRKGAIAGQLIHDWVADRL